MLADVTLEANVLGTLTSRRSRRIGRSMREQAVLYTALDCLGSQAPPCLQCAVYTKICLNVHTSHMAR